MGYFDLETIHQLTVRSEGGSETDFSILSRSRANCDCGEGIIDVEVFVNSKFSVKCVGVIGAYVRV